MKEITAILIDFSGSASLNKALHSLKRISSLLTTVTVLQNEAKSSKANQLQGPKELPKVNYRKYKNNQLGDTLNQISTDTKCNYILFLKNDEYLSPSAKTDILNLPPSRSILIQTDSHKNIQTQNPIFIRSTLLEKHPFLPEYHLPFWEAFFPAWLSGIEKSFIKVTADILRKTSKSFNPNVREKSKFTSKYQLEKVQTNHPSLAIIMANYNMEKYVENAIASCILQNEQADKIYIIDDGSTDQSYRRIKNWRNESSVHILQKANGGKARALNELLPLISTDFILELDADDWLGPDAVSVIKAYLENLPADVAVLYGNFRRWKQEEDIHFKQVAMGRQIKTVKDFLAYRFPLGPRIYRTASLKAIGGFPILSFQDGRLYEDVSVLHRMIQNYRFLYENFTVYNVREHKESITKQNLEHWSSFLKQLSRING